MSKIFKNFLPLIAQADIAEKKIFIRRLGISTIAGLAILTGLVYALLPQYWFVAHVSAATTVLLLIGLLAFYFGHVTFFSLLVVFAPVVAILIMAFGSQPFKIALFMLSLPIVLSSFLFRIPFFIVSSLFILLGNLVCVGDCLLSRHASLMISVTSLCCNIVLFAVSLAAHLKRVRLENMNKHKIIQALDATIFALAYAAELRDTETARHLERTSLYTRMLAEELQCVETYRGYIDEDYINDLAKSSILHDIGKVGVSDAILLKPEKLTVEEFNEIKKHPAYGASILEVAMKKLSFRTFFDIAKQIVLCHHEKWDGSGYPAALAGEKIPISARVVALADAYDAMRSNRPYKRAISHEKCCEIIRKDSGRHFDPVVVDCFFKREMHFARISHELRD